MVVAVAVITLFTELSVDNTIPTSAHLNSNSNNAHVTHQSTVHGVVLYRNWQKVRLQVFVIT